MNGNYLQDSCRAFMFALHHGLLKHPLPEFTTLAADEMDLPHNPMLPLLEMTRISNLGNPG